MALVGGRRAVAPQPLHGSPPAPRAPWYRSRGAVTAILLVLAYLTFVVWAVSVASRGVAGHPRKANPNAGDPVLPAWLGVDGWTIPTTVFFVAAALLILGGLVVLSIRQRRCHVALIVFLAAQAMALVDPLGNWATFTVYNPHWAHFPLDWPWMRLSPTVEPIFPWVGSYPVYFFCMGLLTYGVYTKFVRPRIRPGSWFSRHPLLTVGGLGLAIAIPIDTVAEIVWMRQGMYLYSEAIGPTINTAHVTFPIIWGFYQWWLVAIAAVLMVRDDRGQSLILVRLGRRFSRNKTGNVSALKQILIGAVFVNVLTLVPIGFYTALRVSEVTHPSYDKWPFPQSATYDPYGDAERAGKPGPYFK